MLLVIGDGVSAQKTWKILPSYLGNVKIGQLFSRKHGLPDSFKWRKVILLQLSLGEDVPHQNVSGF